MSEDQGPEGPANGQGAGSERTSQPQGGQAAQSGEPQAHQAAGGQQRHAAGGQAHGGQPAGHVGGQPAAHGHRSPYAGFWKRFGAYLIDTIILAIPLWILMFALVGGAVLSGSPDAASGAIGVLWLVSLAAPWLYFALFESSSWQATPGKRALSIKVTDEHGRQLSFGRATGRYFGKFLSALILLIGFFMAGFTEKKQCLHDMIASCLVVNAWYQPGGVPQG